MTKKKEELDGVWRTIGGRRVFIRNGQSLSEAMIQSGKFKGMKGVQKKGYTNEQYQKQDDKIGILKQRVETLRREEIMEQKGWDPSQEPSADLESVAWDRENAEWELYEEKKKREDMDKNPYGERKVSISKYAKNNLSNLTNEKIMSKEEYEKYASKIPNREKYASTSYDDYVNAVKDAGTGSEKRANDELKYMAGEKKYNSVEERYNKDKEFKNSLKKEHQKTLDTTRKEIQSYLDDEISANENLGIDGKDDFYDYINRNYWNISKKDFDKIYAEEKSKKYAKELRKNYMAEEDYDDKITPKYIQDIDSARYGDMTDEEAIANWIDGGADLIYYYDAEELLKDWGMPVKNNDAYSTYRDEIAKNLLPMYKNDKRETSLKKMPLGDLKNLAKDYNINTKGLSKNDLIEKLLAIYNK